MPPIKYRGRNPDSDHSVLHKKYVDDRYATVRVDQNYIDSQVALEVPSLVKPDYVDSMDALRAHRTAVDAADANYVPLTQLGAPNGTAKLGSDAYVPPAQPPLQTERPVFFKNVDTVFLTANYEVSSVNPKEYEAARLTVPDLGYPYLPLIFAIIQGGSINGTTMSRAMGTGSYAQISVLRSDNVRYGWAVTTGQKVLDYSHVIPAPDAGAGMTCTASATFGLWLGLHTGTTYTFTPTALQFYAMCYPAI